MSKAQQNAWHPLTAEVLALLVREEGGPTVDEQLTLAGRIAALQGNEQNRVVKELTVIGRRLGSAGEQTAEGCVRSIAGLAVSALESVAIERRVFR